MLLGQGEVRKKGEREREVQTHPAEARVPQAPKRGTHTFKEHTLLSSPHKMGDAGALGHNTIAHRRRHHRLHVTSSSAREKTRAFASRPPAPGVSSPSRQSPFRSLLSVGAPRRGGAAASEGWHTRTLAPASPRVDRNAP